MCLHGCVLEGLQRLSGRWGTVWKYVLCACKYFGPCLQFKVSWQHKSVYNSVQWDIHFLGNSLGAKAMRDHWAISKARLWNCIVTRSKWCSNKTNRWYLQELGAALQYLNFSPKRRKWEFVLKSEELKQTIKATKSGGIGSQVAYQYSNPGFPLDKAE